MKLGPKLQRMSVETIKIILLKLVRAIALAELLADDYNQIAFGHECVQVFGMKDPVPLVEQVKVKKQELFDNFKQHNFKALTAELSLISKDSYSLHAIERLREDLMTPLASSSADKIIDDNSILKSIDSIAELDLDDPERAGMIWLDYILQYGSLYKDVTDPDAYRRCPVWHYDYKLKEWSNSKYDSFNQQLLEELNSIPMYCCAIKDLFYHSLSKPVTIFTLTDKILNSGKFNVHTWGDAIKRADTIRELHRNKFRYIPKYQRSGFPMVAIDDIFFQKNTDVPLEWLAKKWGYMND